MINVPNKLASCKRNMCRIVDGGEGEEFSIVRENDFLVVLRANPGCLFTGK